MIIRMENFMRHDKTVIDLPPTGLVVVTGANGAGKSALVEAVATAMWGKAARGARWSGWRKSPGLIRIEDGALMVERRWSGKAKTLRWQGAGWSCADAPTFDTTTKAQDALDAVVGSFDVWRRTCVLSAADAAHFTLATDSERKQLLETLLGLGWFEGALTACRRDLRSAETQLGLARREESVVQQRVQANERTLMQARDVLEEVAPLPDVGFARALLARIREHLRDLAEEREQIKRRLLEASRAGGADEARAQAIDAQLRRLSGSSECYACGQELTVAARQALEDDARARRAAAANAQAQARADLGDLASEDDELAREESKLRAREDRVRAELAQRDAAVAQRTQLQRVVATVLAELEAANAALSKASASAAQFEIEVAELRACEQVLGIRGARARIIGDTLSSLEAMSNAWLGRLSSSIRIRLRAYTEKKTGGASDAISLTLEGAGGDEVGDYAGASTGERRRVDVAILMALTELSGNAIAPGGWRSPMFFDEVFDGLDGDGREAVLEVVGSIARERCVVLITHDEQLAANRADMRIRVDHGRVTT